MDHLRNWIINIVITMIFVVFIEILMPSSNMRKYINFVVGLLVMLVILGPLLNIASGDFSMSGKILEVSGVIDAKDVRYQLDKIEEGHKEGIVRTYKHKLQEQISNQIRSAGLAKNVDAEVFIDEEYGSESFGTITGIRVIVREGGSTESGQPVQKVEIRVDIEEDRETAGVLSHQDRQLRENISAYLADLYNLSPENIDIVLEQM